MNLFKVAQVRINRQNKHLPNFKTLLFSEVQSTIYGFHAQEEDLGGR